MACSPIDYDYLRHLVLAQSANIIGPSHNSLFDTRLTPLARLSGSTSLEEFVGQLRRQPAGRLHRLVAEAMTINETSFFRDLKPFEAIRADILPRLLERRRESRTLRVWSAACSTGQEANSVAMLLREHFPELESWNIRILGTDISASVVDYAKAGRYRRIEINRGLPARMLVKHFVRLGEEWEISPDVRGMCEFRQMNLSAALPPLPTFDLVLLRNVMIYFSRQDRSSLLSDVHRLLADDGALVLGNAEQAEDTTDGFAPVFAQGTFYYQKS